MKFKLDENFGARTQQVFQNQGYDVKTVLGQKLQGCSDQRLYEVCCDEKRCLVTLDLDFADITRFPPTKTNGIVVIRVPRQTSFGLLEQMINQFLNALTQMTVEKKLWVVELNRIRIHETDIDGDDTKIKIQ